MPSTDSASRISGLLRTVAMPLAVIIVSWPGTGWASPIYQEDVTPTTTPTVMPTATLTPSATDTPTPTATTTPTPTEIPASSGSSASAGAAAGYIRLSGDKSPSELNLVPASGWLNGMKGIDVYRSPGDRITDIDWIDNDGVLWEMKSNERMQYSADVRLTLMTQFSDSERTEKILDDITVWYWNQVASKIMSYVEARALMPYYENAPIGIYLHRPTIDPDETSKHPKERDATDPATGALLIDDETEAKEKDLFRNEMNDIIDHLNSLNVSSVPNPILIKWED